MYSHGVKEYSTFFNIDLKQEIKRKMDVQRKKEAKLSVGVGSSRKGFSFHLVNIFINKAVSVFTKGIVQTYK